MNNELNGVGILRHRVTKEIGKPPTLLFSEDFEDRRGKFPVHTEDMLIAGTCSVCGNHYKTIPGHDPHVCERQECRDKRWGRV